MVEHEAGVGVRFRVCNKGLPARTSSTAYTGVMMAPVLGQLWSNMILNLWQQYYCCWQYYTVVGPVSPTCPNRTAYTAIV